ncbi:amidohydrolase [Anditalea andensis]|uniref:Amidohydrolase n=1 Tax=Anditalea andensis TaxID=1048983 RepID=A0A074LLU2_9BACT|nr:amidohydrolase [Anditalea andensis]KEO74842.1 amidohydrolase [Anditalea andensis]
MKKYLQGLIPLFLFSCLYSCGEQKESVDLIVHGGIIYTVDENFSQAEAFAVKDGRFVAVGSSSDILSHYISDDMLDLQGQVVYPGFIDAHAHFYRYGTSLIIANLTGSDSFDELIKRVTVHRDSHQDQEWILGRGWDQNLWEVKEFPTKDRLDELYPDTPVLLTRVDGHAALANQKALDIGGVTAGTNILGGKVLLQNGRPTGVLIDNAIGLVSTHVPNATLQESMDALKAAQENCFKVGLTSVVDAGLDRETIELMQQMHVNQTLKMRIYAMINPTEDNRKYYFEKGPYQDDFLTVKSFKIYGDGALGSRGASLLEPYHDDHQEMGFLLNTPVEFEKLAYEMFENGFQMNTHCIGDSANRTLLNIYAHVLKGENDRRWRIEHAQIVSREDINKFSKYNIIPSVQPTHATSDMYWAEDRLGADRIKTAYTYKDLLEQNGLIALGSDFPVEDINPLYGFHSAVARRDDNNWPSEGFQMENKISRKDALKGMTIWAAYANFEEDLKGSIENGKLADFVIMEEDLMKEAEENLRHLKVLGTYIGGEKVY